MATDPDLAARARALAAYQAARLADTYQDLRSQPRFRAAVDFFLDDLYGPQDLEPRDQQILQALGKLQRFLPAPVLEALAGAFELHVLTLELDRGTAALLPGPQAPDAASYAEAYRGAGRWRERARQIALVEEIGGLLDSVAHRAEVGIAVRLARGPAHAAGYGLLQDFLERGYDAFRAMRGAGEFLATIARRERALMERLRQPGAVVPDPATLRST